MKLPLFLLSLPLPLVLTQSPNSTCHDPEFHNSTIHHPSSTASQCHHLSHLQALISLSSNATRLSAATHNDTASASAIQAAASAAASTLATLTANTTLTSLCAQLSASEADKASCRTLSRLEQIAAIANATTGAAAAFSDAVKSEADAQAAELARLQANATLTALCAGLKTEEACGEMKRLERMVGSAVNESAAVGGERDGQAWVERAQARLDELKGNTTLVAACDALGVEEGKK